MRPVRIVAPSCSPAAVAVTGCAAHSTAVDPPVTPAVDAPAPPAPSPAPKPVPAPKPPAPVAKQPAPVPKPPVDRVAVLADGRSRDRAQVLSTYVRNQNPRLRTVPLAGDLRLDLHGGCEEPISHQLAKLAADARAMSGEVHTYYFTVTVAGCTMELRSLTATLPP